MRYWGLLSQGGPERMISGWTASSRGIALRQRKAKPPEVRTNLAELRSGSKLESCPGFCPCRAGNPPGALCLPLPKSYHLSGTNVLQDIILSFSAGRCRRYLLLRKVFAGTKDSAKCIGPVRCLRPLDISRVKCGGRTLSRPIRASAGNTICLQGALYERIVEDLISACRKTVVVATGSSHSFKVRDNQRPERTMSGATKTSA